MANKDLQKWITSDIDFYQFLGIKFEACTEAELRRAYRKTALKYHPDKVGANFDAEKYEIFQAAYEVLSNISSRAQYDQYRHAKIQRQRENELFEGKRKQMKEDLEAREKNGVVDKTKRLWEDEKSIAEMQPELRRLVEEGRKKRAARASMMARSATFSTSSIPSDDDSLSSKTSRNTPNSMDDDEKIKRLERSIQDAEKMKARRKAEKKARKGGDRKIPVNEFTCPELKLEDQEGKKIRRSISNSRGEKLNEESSFPLNFSFSPLAPTAQKNDFSVTMARLKAAEEARLGTNFREEGSEIA